MHESKEKVRGVSDEGYVEISGILKMVALLQGLHNRMASEIDEQRYLKRKHQRLEPSLSR